MNFYKLCGFLVISCLFSCKSEQKVEIKDLGDYGIVNVFSEDKFQEMKRNYKDVSLTDFVSKDNYADYSYLSLQPNRTYTFLLGNQFMYGSYEFKGEELILSPNEGEKIHLKILDVTDKSVQLHGDFKDFKSDFLVVVDGKSSFYLNLRPEYPIDVVEFDYRSNELNEWRKKPLAPESEYEIKKRLLNNLNYIASYLYSIQMAQKDYVNFKGIRSPFRHAANGIVLNEWDDVDNFWKSIFYDEKDAKLAYMMIKVNIDRGYDIPKTRDWVYLNEYLLRQIIEKVDKSILVEEDAESSN